MLLIEKQAWTVAAPNFNSAYADCGYDWIPDLPDQRDYAYAPPRRALIRPPLVVDMQNHASPAQWEGARLSSAAHAVRLLCRHDAARALSASEDYPALDDYPPDHLLLPALAYRAGLRDVIKAAVSRIGAVADTDRRTRKTRAPRIESGGFPAYLRITQSLAQLKGCLAEGRAFVFGFSVFESFGSRDTLRTGRIAMPDLDEKMLGGMAGLAVGYDESARAFAILLGQNEPAYRLLPYSYLVDPMLAADFWTLRQTPG